MACTLTGWSLMKARVRPSASCTRRRINSSSDGMPGSSISARTGWSSERSKAAVTWPCSAPCRTRATSPRAPSASANASRRIDLPAPVSPVSAARPLVKSISSRSIRTMSRMDSRVSMGEGHRESNRSARIMPILLPVVSCLWSDAEGPADPGALVHRRLKPACAQQRIGVLVPAAVGEIVSKHCGGGLCLAHHAERQIDLSQPQQRLLDVPRGLIFSHDFLKAGRRTRVVAPLLVISADQHSLAGELIAPLLDLALGGYRILSIRIFADHLVEHGNGLLGPLLVARDFANLIKIAGADQELCIGGIRTAGMKLDVAPRRVDGIIVSPGLIIGVGRHDQRFARPLGIRVLPIDLLEALGSALGVPLDVEEIETLVIDAIGRLIEHRIVLGAKQATKALAARKRGRSQCQYPSKPRYSSHTKKRLIRRSRTPTHGCSVSPARGPCHRPERVYPV